MKYIIYLLALLQIIIALLAFMTLLEPNRTETMSEQTVPTFTHFIYFNEDEGEYKVDCFNDEVKVVKTLIDTETNQPTLILEISGKKYIKNSLFSKISVYKTNKYIITDEFIFTNEEIATIKCNQLNKNI